MYKILVICSRILVMYNRIHVICSRVLVMHSRILVIYSRILLMYGGVLRIYSRAPVTDSRIVIRYNRILVIVWNQYVMECLVWIVPGGCLINVYLYLHSIPNALSALTFRVHTYKISRDNLCFGFCFGTYIIRLIYSANNKRLWRSYNIMPSFIVSCAIDDD